MSTDIANTIEIDSCQVTFCAAPKRPPRAARVLNNASASDSVSNKSSDSVAARTDPNSALSSTNPTRFWTQNWLALLFMSGRSAPQNVMQNVTQAETTASAFADGSGTAFSSETAASSNAAVSSNAAASAGVGNTETGDSVLLCRNPHKHRLESTTEPFWVRCLLTGVALLFIFLFLLLPLIFVFVHAFSAGLKVYFGAITDEYTLKAIWLTLIATGIAVPLNIVFGVCAAWCIGKFDFPGKGILVTLIDLPFAISPVIAGMLFVILFGAGSVMGCWLIAHNMPIIFAIPGIVIATIFVTLPFVAKELIPVIQAQGSDEELAARVLGASGWQTFVRVTLPNIKWGLLYGVILCNARAVGEFGAVAVVSGQIRGKTTTVPLHIEQLYRFLA